MEGEADKGHIAAVSICVQDSKAKKIEGSGAELMVEDVASENEQQSSHPQAVPAE